MRMGVDMAGAIEARLRELGIELPAVQAPWANYVSVVKSGALVYLSGQLPALDGQTIKGKLGSDISIEDGRKAARLCALNMLPHLRQACEGNLDRVVRCVEIGGFVNSTPDFTEHPLVLNGASEFLVEVFGEAGRHTRFAVGVSSLPFNFAVEVKGIFEIG
jgi:enamine deaminase RidA (YjgF/YER057c/UK114 family)